ncbi:unnamed protein product [Nippostrongylus brasiliensis]|uniref:Apple domain-containing protein n=1 Tax=Nippostrongylus brasiliensis TaxID=27835 RepID=A0A0N4XWH8_NIPBR|nr:unnamed protein product [Nippostrongylus brasiliensis]
MIVLLMLLTVLRSTWGISSTCFYLPNINLKGGTYDEFDASDITQCCIQCASQPCCAGYTYSKALKRCFMKSSINYSEQEDMMISGIRANANGGVGAKMKNVKIEGSGGSRITLENSDECQQYCTETFLKVYANEHSTAFLGYCTSTPDVHHHDRDNFLF